MEVPLVVTKTASLAVPALREVIGPAGFALVVAGVLTLLWLQVRRAGW